MQTDLLRQEAISGCLESGAWGPNRADVFGSDWCVHS